MKPILCVDFDGVIHSYEHGWQGGKIYGSVTLGFFEWLRQAQDHFAVVVYSSRSKTVEGRLAMPEWVATQYLEWIADGGKPLPEGSISALRYAAEKPPAYLTIDDRAVCFDGDWGKLTVKTMLAFKPWNASK